VRSWSKDLDTLIRLHKSLRALDADDGGEQEPLSARVMSAPPAELLAPPQDKVAQDEPERPLVSDQACYPAAAYLQETQPVDATCREIPGQEMTAGQMLSPDAPPAQTSPETRPSQPLAPKDGHGEAAQVQSPDVAPEHAAAGPDPAIVAIKETFRYVADAGDKAVSFFYGQLFLRQPQLRQLFPPAMDEQRDRLFHALSRIVESLATPDEMAAYLSQLGRDHRKYQVEPDRPQIGIEDREVPGRVTHVEHVERSGTEGRSNRSYDRPVTAVTVERCPDRSRELQMAALVAHGLRPRVLRGLPHRGRAAVALTSVTLSGVATRRG